MNKKIKSIVKEFSFQKNWLFPFDSEEEENIFIDNNQKYFSSLTDQEIKELFIYLDRYNLLDIWIFNNYLKWDWVNSNNRIVSSLFDEYFQIFKDNYIHSSHSSVQLIWFELKKALRTFFANVLTDKKILIDRLNLELKNISNVKIKKIIENEIKELEKKK